MTGSRELPRVGVIGLGNMGAAMAQQLIRAGRWQVFGYDIVAARRADLVEAGGYALDSVTAVAAIANVIVVSLPSIEAFEAVTADLSRQPVDGLVVIETSTLPLTVKLRGRDLLAEGGVTLLDCPLSGTGQQARAGDLVAYVSGDAVAIERAVGVIAGFTRSQHQLGEFGNGTRMKLIANLLVAVHNVASAEALLLAQRAGLDLTTVLAAVGDGAGTSRMFEVRGPLMVADTYQPATISNRVFAKDLAIIDEFATALGSPTPLFAAANVVYRAAMSQGREEDDTAAVYAVLRQLSSRADSLPTYGKQSRDDARR